MNGQNTTLEQHVKSVTSGTLRSDKLNQAWRKQHFSERNENPMLIEAEALDNLEGDLSENPNAIKFIYELAQIHIGALSKTSNKDTEAHDLKKQLENMCDFVADITYPTTLLEDTELTKDQNRILDTVRAETAQGPGPVVSFWQNIKHGFHHLYEDTKEFAGKYPKTATFAAGVPLAAVAYSYMVIKPPKTGGIDSNTTGYTNYMDAMLADDTSMLNYDQSAIIDNVPLTCHDHLTQIMFGWEKGAEFITDTFNLDEEYFEHCSVIANKIYDSNELARAIKEDWHLRIDATVLQPIQHLAANILPDSTWKETFMTSMINVHDFFKAGNDGENALHPLIAAAVWISVHKLATKPLRNMQNADEDYTAGLDELREIFHGAVDFGRKAWSTPLNWLLMTGGSTLAYNVNNSFTEMIIGGVLGLTTGAVAHEVAKKSNSTDFAKQSTLTIREYTTAFSNPADIVSGRSAAGAVITPAYEQNFFEKWTNTKAKLAVAGTTTFLALDAIATGGKVSASVAGGGLMAAADMLYNLFEDPALHAIFAGIGSAGAGITSGIAWGKHLLSGKSDSNNGPDQG